MTLKSQWLMCLKELQNFQQGRRGSRSGGAMWKRRLKGNKAVTEIRNTQCHKWRYSVLQFPWRRNPRMWS